MSIANGDVNQLIWRNNQNRYQMDDINTDLDKPNDSFAILAKQVEFGSAVLDVACGQGRWGAVLAQKECQIWGIDIDQTAIEHAEASGNYTRIWQMDIENPDKFSQAYEELKILIPQLDCIGMLDILEHTVNPTQVLMNFVPRLKEGGKVLISVPNIGHADIFLNLIKGNFNYQKMGILDNTHTKSFTRRSFMQWIKEINEYGFGFKLDCEYLGGTHSTTSFLEQVKREEPFLYNMVKLNPEYDIVQLLFVLTKKDETSSLQFENELLNDDSNILEIINERASHSKQLHDDVQMDLTQTQVDLDKSQKDLAETQSYLEQSQKGLAETKMYLEQSQKDLAETQMYLEQSQKGLAEMQMYLDQSQKDLAETQTYLDQALKEVDYWREMYRKKEDQVLDIESKWKEAAVGWNKSSEGWVNCHQQLQDMTQELDLLKKNNTEYIEHLEAQAYQQQIDFALKVKEVNEQKTLIDRQQKKIYQLVKYKDSIESSLIGKLAVKAVKADRID